MQAGRGGFDILVPPTRWCEGEEAVPGLGGVFQDAKGLADLVLWICMQRRRVPVIFSLLKSVRCAVSILNNDAGVQDAVSAASVEPNEAQKETSRIIIQSSAKSLLRATKGFL